ncbi:hypothetical protein [Bifidobacterium miconisargentati]|uniref:hypothetical protein n=1 Tax=Bifidobacterium miconisargentati TaxID=2834437 RepID=UPI001BDBB3A4|nr:hypothetical protein [Bifidobacterium miconisargentati]MBW3091214.1 hypothetical protein [Bifidobacterium miconisargentati]
MTSETRRSSILPDPKLMALGSIISLNAKLMLDVTPEPTTLMLNVNDALARAGVPTRAADGSYLTAYAAILDTYAKGDLRGGLIQTHRYLDETGTDPRTITVWNRLTIPDLLLITARAEIEPRLTRRDLTDAEHLTHYVTAGILTPEQAISIHHQGTDAIHDGRILTTNPTDLTPDEQHQYEEWRSLDLPARPATYASIPDPAAGGATDAGNPTRRGTRRRYEQQISEETTTHIANRHI